MKPSSHPFYQRSKYGLYYETILKPKLEDLIGEPILKTTMETDTMDFESETAFIELKTRSDQYHPSQSFIKKDGWILPYCKIQRAREEVAKGKRVIFFYFWLAGKTLYRWDFSEAGILDAKVEYPAWHRDHQQQIYIKEHHWTLA